MSVALMSLVWEIRWPTQSQLLIALKLADHANDEGANVYPSKSRIAEQAQCSESTVKNALRAFRDCGILRVTKKGGNGPGSTTIYEINVDLLKRLAAAKAVLKGTADSIEIPDELAKGSTIYQSTVDPLDEERGQSDSEKGSTETEKGSKLLTPNHHILEPSYIEPSESSHARESGFSGKFISLSTEQVSYLEESFPNLCFPGDLIGADSFLAEQIKGHAALMTWDAKYARLTTYLARRNREAREIERDRHTPAALSERSRRINEMLRRQFQLNGASA